MKLTAIFYPFSATSGKLSLMSDEIEIIPLANRFRGFLPVVVDVETGRFNFRKEALLEVAAGIWRIDEQVSNESSTVSLRY